MPEKSGQTEILIYKRLNFRTENLEIVGLVNQKVTNGWQDLTPLDLYFWRKLKEEVCHKKPTIKLGMQEHIKRTCSIIDTNEICQAVPSVLQCFRLCIHDQLSF